MQWQAQLILTAIVLLQCSCMVIAALHWLSPLYLSNETALLYSMLKWSVPSSWSKYSGFSNRYNVHSCLSMIYLHVNGGGDDQPVADYCQWYTRCHQRSPWSTILDQSAKVSSCQPEPGTYHIRHWQGGAQPSLLSVTVLHAVDNPLLCISILWHSENGYPTLYWHSARSD